MKKSIRNGAHNVRNVMFRGGRDHAEVGQCSAFEVYRSKLIAQDNHGLSTASRAANIVTKEVIVGVRLSNVNTSPPGHVLDVFRFGVDVHSYEDFVYHTKSVFVIFRGHVNTHHQKKGCDTGSLNSVSRKRGRFNVR